MALRDIFGLATAFLVLAGIAFAITNDGKTANIVKTSGDSFGGLIKAATNPAG